LESILDRSLLKKIFEKSNHINSFDLVKREAIFYVEDNSNQIRKGFSLIESTYALSLYLWFNPKIYFYSSLFPHGVFAFYDLEFQGARKEIHFHKDEYTLDQIVSLTCEAINDNIEFIKSIRSPLDILNSILKKETRWSDCVFNKENLAILCFLYNEKIMAENLLREALSEISEHHPIHKNIQELYTLTSTNDIAGVESFIRNLADKCPHT
jgi:hypothetical protein